MAELGENPNSVLEPIVEPADPVVEVVEESKPVDPEPTVVTVVEEAPKEEPVPVEEEESKTKDMNDEEIHPIVVDLIRTITEKIETRRNTAAAMKEEVIDSAMPSPDQSKVVIEIVPDPITRQPTVVVKHIKEAEEVGSIHPSRTSTLKMVTATGSNTSISDAGTSPAPDDPSKLIVELIQDPVTRRPTIIIKPAVQTISKAPTLQQVLSVEELTKTIRYIAKHPHMGPIMVKVLRAIGYSKEKAYVKAVKWGLFTLE
jgi:hypothetical protein